MTETTARRLAQAETAAAAAEELVRADQRAVMAGLTPPNPHALRRAVRAVLPFLPAGHPVAEVAQRSCREFGHVLNGGSVACGSCWEHALRADERFVVNFELSEEDQEPDPFYVDQIAVERAMAGEPVRLTLNEQREVARRMRLGGHGPLVTAQRARTHPRRLPAPLMVEGAHLTELPSQTEAECPRNNEVA